MKFAKLFDTAHNGQILVFVGFGQMGEPCMNILSSMDDSPEIQHARTSYPADMPIEEAIAGIQAMFNEVDETRAIAVVTAYAEQSAGPFPAIVEEAPRALSDLATHRCTICHALWRFCPKEQTGFETDTWSLKSPKCGPCCDNVEMGDQIVPLDPFVSEGGETD